MLKIKNVLISQPAPAEYDKSPYKQLATKFSLKIVFRKFIKIEGLCAREFRLQKINFLDYTAVIFTSRNAVDHYFRMAQEMRLKIPITMKYFCSSETTAFYIQNYIQYRKRKIFYGKQTTADLVELVSKHKEEKFLLPCSEESNVDLPNALSKAKIQFIKAPIYRTVPDKLTPEININDFDLLAFFSPVGIKSLVSNYPKFKQKNVLIAAFGTSVCAAVEEAGFRLDIAAPTPTATSMAHAIEEYIADYNKCGGDLQKMPERYKETVNSLTNSGIPKETSVKATVKSKTKAIATTTPKGKGNAVSTTKTTAKATAKATSKANGNALETKAAANKAAAIAVIAGKKGRIK